jgi:HEPN domain-containing protein
MRQIVDAAHWRSEAEKYLETAAVLYRKGKYPQMLHHCYFALQSAFEAAFFDINRSRAPESVSLVVFANALEREWNDAERGLLLTLTEYARAIADGELHHLALDCTKERCLRDLTLTASLISELR